jgi:hypothetical protein
MPVLTNLLSILVIVKKKKKKKKKESRKAMYDSCRHLTNMSVKCATRPPNLGHIWVILFFKYFF